MSDFKTDQTLYWAKNIAEDLINYYLDNHSKINTYELKHRIQEVIFMAYNNGWDEGIEDFIKDKDVICR